MKAFMLISMIVLLESAGFSQSGSTRLKSGTITVRKEKIMPPSESITIVNQDTTMVYKVIPLSKKKRR